jgi:hypothetical protein
MTTQVMYTRTLLNGGSTAAIDNIDGNSLNYGDLCIIYTTNYRTAFYQLVNSTESEDLPERVTPDQNNTNKRWKLMGNFISATNKIGIGTTNPQAPLDVRGAIHGSSRLKFSVGTSQISGAGTTGLVWATSGVLMMVI